MNKNFKELAIYIKLFDGAGKPRINFQDLYKLFPQFTFTATEKFGQYTNFGEAFENKNLSMTVTDEKGHECTMIYKEYADADENTAYVS